MEYVLLIVVCGLFANSLTTNHKLKELKARIKDIENKAGIEVDESFPFPANQPIE